MQIKLRMTRHGLLAGLAICLLATACNGGGGGGSSDSSPSAPEPVPEPPAPALFSISGTITASSSQTVDSDTNDPGSQAISNDTVATAQPIPNPITLGGYINQPGTGAPGRSQQAGDIDDFFQVDLLAGQTITMLVADFKQGDADLYLWDAQGRTILELSVDIGELETLVVPADGTYLVNANAYAGATNYILAIGAPGTASQRSTRRHSIVPWQAVVKYRDNDPSLDIKETHRAIARRQGMEQRAGGRGRGRLMALRRDRIIAARAGREPEPAAGKRDHISDPDLGARWETLMTIKSLRREPQVEYAEPNYQVTAFSVPNDVAYPAQWHYPLIGLPEAWDTSTGDPGVVIAVVDTGILPNHPDLAGQLVDGYDFVRDPASALDGDGIDPNPRDPGNAFTGSASSFHGTHVSGTVAAKGDNSLGVAGAAYTSRIMPVRALGAGGAGTSYDVNQAIRFAAGLANDSGTLPQQPADIINLSLGGGPFSQASQDLFNEVRAAGVIVVAAAGNEASASPTYPASYDAVISVSAIDAQRRLASYSNTGAQIDIAAPGGDNGVDLNGDGYPDGVLSTAGSSTANGLEYVYSFLSGTSMAAPHVAGVLALVKSVNPLLTPDDIDALLVRGDLTDEAGAPGRDDQYGHGIVNAQQAILAALEAGGSSPADSPRLVASASTLNFGANTQQLELLLRNGGKGELALLGLTVSQPWLAIAPFRVDTSDLGTYRVSVERNDLPAGVYAANITALSDVNHVDVRVLISVGGAGTAADVGLIYTLLYDAETDEVIDQFVSAGKEGKYPFEFNDIARGEYELITGTDADNDLFICDAGEACGAWLTLDQPIRIQLESDIDDIDFPVEYLVSLPSVGSKAQPDNDPGKRAVLPGTGKGIAKTAVHKDD